MCFKTAIIFFLKSIGTRRNIISVGAATGYASTTVEVLASARAPLLWAQAVASSASDISNEWRSKLERVMVHSIAVRGVAGRITVC